MRGDILQDLGALGRLDFVVVLAYWSYLVARSVLKRTWKAYFRSLRNFIALTSFLILSGCTIVAPFADSPYELFVASVASYLMLKSIVIYSVMRPT